MNFHAILEIVGSLMQKEKCLEFWNDLHVQKATTSFLVTRFNTVCWL